MLVTFVLCLSSCGGNNDTDPASSTPSQISTGQSASQTQKASGVAGTSAQSRDDKGSGDNDSQSNAQAPDNKAEKHEAGSDNSGTTAAMIKMTCRQEKKPYLRQKAMKAAERRRTTSPKPKAAGQAKTIKKALTATGLRI